MRPRTVAAEVSMASASVRGRRRGVPDLARDRRARRGLDEEPSAAPDRKPPAFRLAGAVEGGDAHAVRLHAGSGRGAGPPAIDSVARGAPPAPAPRGRSPRSPPPTGPGDAGGGGGEAAAAERAGTTARRPRRRRDPRSPGRGRRRRRRGAPTPGPSRARTRARTGRRRAAGSRAASCAPRRAAGVQGRRGSSNGIASARRVRRGRRRPCPRPPHSSRCVACPRSTSGRSRRPWRPARTPASPASETAAAPVPRERGGGQQGRGQDGGRASALDERRQPRVQVDVGRQRAQQQALAVRPVAQHPRRVGGEPEQDDPRAGERGQRVPGPRATMRPRPAAADRPAAQDVPRGRRRAAPPRRHTRPRAGRRARTRARRAQRIARCAAARGR